MENVIQTIAVYAIPVIFAITLHEAAHGYVAKFFGDNTAQAAGRISLNPMRHIDPVGTIAVPIAILVIGRLLGGATLLFGWAKPVPVNFSALRHPKRDMLWVALAGPMMNLAMAVAWNIAYGLLGAEGAGETFFLAVAEAGVQVNIVIMALNLLPVPPLDGGRIVISLLPHRLAWNYARLEPYGMPILLGLMMVPGLLGALISPLMAAGFFIVELF